MAVVGQDTPPQATRCIQQVKKLLKSYGIQPKQLVMQYAVNAWLPRVEHLTFKTTLLELSNDETFAIYNAQKRSFHGAKNVQCDPELDNKIALFKKKIGKAISEYPGGALSTRSPKDATLTSPILRECFNKEIEGLPPGDENADMIAWYRAVVKAMRVSDEEQAWSLLHNSCRVYQDIEKWKTLQTDVPLFLVIRDWQFIDPATEFRCFISHKRVTAISQYLDSLFFDSLTNKTTQSAVISAIQHWYNMNGEAIQYEVTLLCNALLFIQYCVLDLIVSLSDPYLVTLIEINPFFVKTGAALFDWVADQDILLGTSTSAEPVLRCIESKEKRRCQGFGSIRDSYTSPPVQDNKNRNVCVIA